VTFSGKFLFQNIILLKPRRVSRSLGCWTELALSCRRDPLGCGFIVVQIALQPLQHAGPALIRAGDLWVGSQAAVAESD